MGAAHPSPERHCPSCGASYPTDYAVCPRDATPLLGGNQNEDPLLGTILGDTYEVQRLLGEGGMGRVYEARHVRLGRRVAVKLLQQMFTSDRDALARFRREATAAASIESPHVAQIFDVNATREGRPYLVYELLDGEDLATVLERDGSLPIARAIVVANQVAQGLGVAHKAGVVHRDLKPENIMMVRGADGGDVVKVLDFGIAKVLEDDKLTRTGAILGTPAYMAPEQARGGSTIDQRCDIYALGAILYRALTGRPAFSGEDAGRTLTSVIWDEPERPKTLRKDLPDALELVVQRAMAKDPAARYASMAELQAALAPFADTPSPLVQPLPPSVPGDVGRAATMVAAAATLSIATPERTTTIQATRARPRAIAYGLVLLAWCITVTGSLLGTLLVRLSHHALTSMERGLDVALAVAVSAPLAVLEVRRFLRGAWRNTATMLGRADKLGRAALLSLSTYAGISAPARFWSLLVNGGGAPVGTELLALFAAALVAAAVLIER